MYFAHPASIPVVQSTCRFTRWCRERFEIDDVREANTYCQTNEAKNAEGTTNGESKQEEDDIEEQVSHPSQEENAFSTRMPPRELRSSYSTITNRQAAERQPDLFAPHTSPPLRSRTRSMVDSRMSPIMEEPVSTRAMRSMPSLGEGVEDGDYQANDQEREGDEGYDELPSDSQVTINPPHPPWDDNSFQDEPYENLYYTFPIKDALWLPLNPVGALDLDATVTMGVALTSEPGAGRLGPLGEKFTSVGSVLSGLTADLEPATSVSGDEVSISGSPLDGTEEIELAPTAAPRVQNEDNGDTLTMDQELNLLRTVWLRPMTPPAPPIITNDTFLVSPSLLTGSLRPVSGDSLLGTVGAAGGRAYPGYPFADGAHTLAEQRPTHTSPPSHLSLNQMHSTSSIGRCSLLPPPPDGASSHFTRRSRISHMSSRSIAIQEALDEEIEVLRRSHVLLREEEERQNAPRFRWTSWAFEDLEQTTSYNVTTHRP